MKKEKKRYWRCKLGFHKWKYLIFKRVCLICGRSDDYDGMGITTTLSQPIYKLKKAAEIKEAQVFIEYMNRDRDC